MTVASPVLHDQVEVSNMTLSTICLGQATWRLGQLITKHTTTARTKYAIPPLQDLRLYRVRFATGYDDPCSAPRDYPTQNHCEKTLARGKYLLFMLSDHLFIFYFGN